MSIEAPPTTRSAPASAAPPRLLGSTSRWLSLGIGVLALVVFFSVASEDWLTTVDYTMIAAIAALGLNVLSGYTGQVSLGITFFMGIGAYTAAVLGGTPPTTPLDPQGLGLSFLIWLPAAGIAAALAGVPGYCIAGPGFYRALYLQECPGYNGRPAGTCLPRTSYRRCLIQPTKRNLGHRTHRGPAVFPADPAHPGVVGAFCRQCDALTRRASFPGRTRQRSGRCYHGSQSL